MAYKGYLLKLGDYIVPHDVIRADSYSSYINMQDVEPWTDADGFTHRNPVELKALKVEFETVAQMTDKTFGELMRNIRANFISEIAKSLNITAYIPELDDYVTQLGYMVDITPKIYGVFNGVIKYDPVRMAFTGGVADD